MRGNRRRRRALRGNSSAPHSQRLHIESLEERRPLAVVGGFELLKDINATHDPAGSFPAGFVELNGVAYYTANSATPGTELWRSDGTPGGTILVKDIFPGSPSALGSATSAYDRPLTVAGGALFFQAFERSTGLGLWKTDGTEAGTMLVKDIFPGQSSGAQLTRRGQVAALNDTLLFAAYREETGLELWRSDGTDAGTVLVKDILPGVESSFLRDFTVVGDVMYFRANDGATGDELWKTDGTEAGTVLVKDIRLGGQGGMPGSRVPDFTNVGGVLYFAAEDGTSGVDLWRSDGTAVGTVKVFDLNPGMAADRFLAELTEVAGHLYFTSRQNELWVSDGTPAGTTHLRTLTNGMVNGVGQLTNFNGELFFYGNDSTTGAELWKSDGTASGTVLVRDIRPGSSGSLGRNADSVHFTVVGQSLFFAATDASGAELWKTDGTAAGTVMVKDIQPGPIGSINPSTNSGQPLANIAGKLFFRPRGGNTGFELWSSDGTTPGTNLVKDLRAGTANSGAYGLLPLGNTIYFTANDGLRGNELWKTDGTSAGTVLVKDIRPGPNSSFPGPLVEFNGLIYFIANDGVTGDSLWKSDGTPDGTSLVADLMPGVSGRMTNLVNAGGTLYFSGDGPNVGEELWRSDGTAQGTKLVADINPGPGESRPYSMTNIGGTVYFRAYHPATGYELWRTDGTPAGTTLFKDIQPGPEGSRPLRINNLNGVMLFSANDGVAGYELWRSDGTESGTVLMRDLEPGPASSYTRYLQPIGGLAFFFAATSGIAGGLWKTDGTAAGTRLVSSPAAAGLVGGYLWSSMQQAVAGKFLYQASDPVHGDELWMSDGTLAGTSLAYEFVPGTGGSAPESILQFGNRVLLTVITEEYNRELWIGEITPDLLGDFDLDNDVDGSDVLLWQRRLGSPVNQPGSREDASANGVVDAADLALLMLNYGASGGTATPPATTSNASRPSGPSIADAIDAAIAAATEPAPRSYRPQRRAAVRR